MKHCGSTAPLTAVQALDLLSSQYNDAVNALRAAIKTFVTDGTLPDAEARRNGLFVYPELRVSWDGVTQGKSRTRAYGRFTHTGCYSTTVTQPALFRRYLCEQLTLLVEEYGAQIDVFPSQQEIPFPYVIDGSDLTLERSMSAGISQHFPTTELAPPMVCFTPPIPAFRFHILMPYVPIFLWPDYAITLARPLNTSSLIFCLPTTRAM